MHNISRWRSDLQQNWVFPWLCGNHVRGGRRNGLVCSCQALVIVERLTFPVLLGRTNKHEFMNRIVSYVCLFVEFFVFLLLHFVVGVVYQCIRFVAHSLVLV